MDPAQGPRPVVDSPPPAAAGHWGVRALGHLFADFRPSRPNKKFV